MMSIVSLLKTTGARAYLFALLIVGVLCLFLPLAGHLGFEFAALLTLVAAVFAPAVGIAAVGREVGFARPRFGRAAMVAATFSVLALALPVVLILLNGLRKPLCEPWHGALWLVLLPLPTALLAAGVGALFRVRTASALGAGVWTALLLLVSLSLSLATLYFGPAFFFMNHFWGYLPGPLYDEVVPFSASLLLFRGFTLLWGAVVLGVVAAHQPRRKSNPSGVLWVALGLVLLVLSAVAGPRLGFRGSDGFLAASLGERRDLGSVEVYFPREWSRSKKERLLRDVAFRMEQVQSALELTPSRPIRVWVHRSAEEKRKRVGAAATSFAKPWRREIHIHDQGLPHPVLRHELVHALAAEVAKGPFAVPGGLFPNSPLIEGLAVAFDSEPEQMTLLQWARSMRDLGLAPDLRVLLSSSGFWAAAPARAYTYAGAFLRHLVNTHGKDRVLELYSNGKLKTLGEPAALVADFEAMLDGLEVGEEEKSAAQRRYQRPSVLRRACAREVSALMQRGRELLSRAEHQAAAAVYQRACELEPDDPMPLRALLSASLRAAEAGSGWGDGGGDGARGAGQEEQLESLIENLLSHPKLDPSLHAQVLLDLGDAAWRQGRELKAQQYFSEAAKLSLAPASRRAVEARLLALGNPAHARALRPLLAQGEVGLEQLFAMHEHLVGSLPQDLSLDTLGRPPSGDRATTAPSASPTTSATSPTSPTIPTSPTTPTTGTSAPSAPSHSLSPGVAELRGGVGEADAGKALEASAEQGSALVAYLLGRQLTQRGAKTRGIRLLLAAEALGLSHVELERENLRLLLQSQSELHLCEEVESSAARLTSIGSEADQAFANDWLERCRFELAQGWKPL